MSEQDLIELVRELFLGGDSSIPIETATALVDSGICDSLGLVQLATSLESRIEGLAIHDQDITRENLGTIADIKRFLSDAN